MDSLNHAAYLSRYRDVERGQRLCAEAYRKATFYPSGKAEALNEQGFYAFMRMEYDEAMRYFEEVSALTRNELELLVADIHRMKLCQRMGRNKEFYDYRQSALQRLQRIDEEGEVFVTVHERERLRYARSEFELVSATYAYYQQQMERAAIHLSRVVNEEQFRGDTSQWLFARYLTSFTLPESHRLHRWSLEEETVRLHDAKLQQFDLLYSTYVEARRRELIYIEGNAAQGMANLLSWPADLSFYMEHRRHELQWLGYPADTLLPLRLAQQALQQFARYGDDYQTAGAYVTIGRYLNDHGCYTQALDTLQRALTCLGDSLRKSAVPECMSRIHEQLSMTYAGLGNKGESDYHRNLYLDILDRIRQDKEVESRYHALADELRQLNMLLAALILGLAGVIFFFLFFTRTSRRRSRNHLNKLHQMLNLCQCITGSIPPEAQSTQEVEEALLTAIRPHLPPLFGTDEVTIRDKSICFCHPLHKDEEAMLRVINPYVEWAIENGQTSVCLEEQRQLIEEQRAIHEQRIAENKRQNMDKRACLSVVNGIQPFIDRILNEVNRTPNEITEKKLQYIDELATTIQEYNEIVAQWIKMRQGTVSLHIESFALDELFRLMQKSNRTFEMKGLQLEVVPTSLIVKADKALTLFMLNTLTENARKYTPRGGHIRIQATLLTENHHAKNDTSALSEIKGTADAKRNADKVGIHPIKEETEIRGQETVVHHGGVEYVEISVVDDGPGLSAADVHYINCEKIYDSSRLGMDTASDPAELKRKKGNGFGLMNCKGIMDKYRKSSALYHNCQFGVESSPGKGCRFFFRLPQGVLHLILLIGLFFSPLLPLCASTTHFKEVLSQTLTAKKAAELPSQEQLSEREAAEAHLQEQFFKRGTAEKTSQEQLSEREAAEKASQERPQERRGKEDFSVQPLGDANQLINDYAESLLDTASYYADNAYFSNVDGLYEESLLYADSAIQYLNRHASLISSVRLPAMQLTGEGEPAELLWWKAPFDSDFHIILDVRNEAAVALLALKQWEGYRYNNHAYTTLYKLLGEDRSLEEYCQKLERSTEHKTVAILLCSLLIATLCIGYLLLYYRRWLNSRWNMEQVLEINHRLYASSQLGNEMTQELREGNDTELSIDRMNQIPLRMVKESFDAMNGLVPLLQIRILYSTESTTEPSFSHSADSATDDSTSSSAETISWPETIHESGEEIALPLQVEQRGSYRRIGTLCLVIKEGYRHEDNCLLLQLVANYWSVVLYNAVVKLTGKYHSIDTLTDETRRASWEESRLHVQNMVLDNCLSTIKHETAYYPGKIKQLTEKLRSTGATDTVTQKRELSSGTEPSHTATSDTLMAIGELVDYYKHILLILSSCAARQMESVNFRRQAIPVSQLVHYVQQYFLRAIRTMPHHPTLLVDVEGEERMVWGDLQLVQILLENLINGVLSNPNEGELRLRLSDTQGEFIRFDLEDSRCSYPEEQLNGWFHPSLERMTRQASGRCKGNEYLVCKEIIRLHDELAGRRGCRINAVPLMSKHEKGVTLYFTLPSAGTKAPGLQRMDTNRV